MMLLSVIKKIILTLYLPIHLNAATILCKEVVVEIPRLQNTTNKEARSLEITRVEVDEDGAWFVLNTKVSNNTSIKSDILGLSRIVEGKSWMPHPRTMTRLLKKNRPGNPLSFVAHPDGVLRLDEYLILIARDQLPIGFDGLYLHDVLDHALGYALLAETPAWPVLKKAIQLTIESQKKSARQSLAAKSFLVKINAFLEASTTALPGIFDNINEKEKVEELQLIYRQVDRLLLRATEIYNAEITAL
jgi:hypothetical protein